MIFYTFLVYLQILLQNYSTNQCLVMHWLKHKCTLFISSRCLTCNQKIRPATRAYFQLLRRASAFGRGLHFALRAKTGLIMLFWPILGHFWCPVVTLITFSSNLMQYIFFLNLKKYIFECCNLTRALQSSPLQNPGGGVH